MQTLASFKFIGSVESGSQKLGISGSFSAPNGLDETVQIGTITTEFILINSHAYSRSGTTSSWAQVTPATALTDPRAAFSVLSQVTDASSKGSGYSFGLTGSAAAALISGSTNVTGTATVVGGRIATLSYESSQPAISIHITYSSFNSGPTITAPPQATAQS